jgi:hypothetical protein
MRGRRFALERFFARLSIAVALPAQLLIRLTPLNQHHDGRRPQHRLW